jgi:YYY domain-containing protein
MVGEMQTEVEHGSRQSVYGFRFWSLVMLVGILVIGGYLRFVGLNWDEGQYIHPDEGHMRNTLSLISWPDDLSLYFDTHRSPLNVRNVEGRRYSYGTLPLFVARGASEWLDTACSDSPAPLSRTVASLVANPSISGCSPGTFTGVYSAVVGRALSALADLGTVVLVYLIGRRLYGETTGLLAAGLGAVTAFLIQQAHFFTVDSPACFLTTLVAYFSVRASQTGGWLDFALAGLNVGLAAASKVSAATAALLVGLAGVYRLVGYAPRKEAGKNHLDVDRSHFWSVFLALCVAGLLSLVAFRTTQPYAFEGPGFFGVQPSSEWFGRLSEIRAEQAGEVDLPSGRQWANRQAVVFPWLNIVVWGMGLPLGLAAWVGWGVAGFELLTGTRRGRKHFVLWGWTTVMFVYYATRWVKTMRYFLPLYPILLAFAAYWLVRLARSASRWWRRIGIGLSGVVVLGAAVWGLVFSTIYVRPHPRVAASRWIYEHVPPGVTVANEHWDWGLPLRVDGHDPFGGMYDGIEMENYNEDTPEKRVQLYEWLDEADYVFLASNRLYASIPRLAARYPLTTEYYRALFAGELGFELEADFTSYPALGPFVFPDQENPFELMEADYSSQSEPIEVRLPPAEEAFSVYDHPRVLIFRKTEAYSRELVEEVLGQVDLGRAQHGRTPREATQAPDLLRFDQETWADQRNGGTWSEMFDRDSLLNRHPGLAAVAWWVVVTVLGWLAFPLLFVALPSLRDRGYGFARLLGLLVVAYLTWLAASIRVFPNTRPTILRMVALVALIGGGVGWIAWDELRRFIRRRWRALLLTEGVFALLFAGWIGVRMLHPDLWHPIMGGEKPMDFAYLNAVMRSTWFPPYNPWLSGTWINYYYFGFVIVGTLIKLVGTVPPVAYNLAVPFICALTGVGALSVAYNLSGGGRRRALLAASVVVVFAVLLGNLGVVHLIWEKLIALGDVSIQSAIPGFQNTAAFFRGLWKVIVEGARLPVRPESWYWHPTRIIPSEAGNPIAEFPAFTFLYGDLHAHMIAFPLTLFALALAVAWAETVRPSWGSLLVGGLVIGALRPTNTWDYPTYLVLGVIALGLGLWRWRRGNEKDGDGPEEGAGRERPPGGELAPCSGSQSLASWIVSFAWRAGVLVGMTLLLYLPFIRHYVSGYTSFHLWEGGTTPVRIYLWIYGMLLFPVATRGVVEVVARVKRGVVSWAVIGVTVAGALGLAIVLITLKYEVALVAVPVGLLAALLFLAADESGSGDRNGSGRFLWLMVGTAMALSLGVEIVVLEGDVERMNTVFKFYLQAWILLAVAAAISLAWIWKRAQGWRLGARRIWWSVMAALVLGGALFLPFGIRARAVDRMAPEAGNSLDGMAFMRHAEILAGPEGDARPILLSGDYHAIRWMQENIDGSPVILEGLGWREYLWANRVSVYTGLPAVVGWRHHQAQQRVGVGGEMVNWRREDVNACFGTADIAQAKEILDRYGVRYIYVGEYERAYYGGALAKFDQMVERGLLKMSYHAHGVAIYEVLS